MSWRRLSYKITQYLAITLFFITILLTTPWGTQVTLAIINTFSPISVDYRSGSLIRDLQLNNLHIALEHLDINISDIETRVDFSCVWKKMLCIKSASAKTLALHYTSSEGSTETKTSNVETATTLFKMPFAININTVTLNKAHISLNKTNIYANQLQTKMVIRQSQFALLYPSVKQLTVHLHDTQKSSENTQNFTSSLTNAVAQLPDVNFPLSLNIEKLQVNSLDIAKNNQVEEQEYLWQSSNNHLSATWFNSDLRIREFKTTTPMFSITELTAKAKLTAPYQINSKLISHIHQLKQWPEIDDTRLQLSLQGSLENLDIELTSTDSLTLSSKANINLVNPDIPFSVTINADNIPLPLSLAQYAEPSALSLTLSGNIQTQSLDLTSSVSSYGYHNAYVKLAATHQQGHLNIKKLLIDEHNSASQLNLQGSITLLPSDFNWQLSMHSTGISLPIINIQKLTEMLEQQTKINSFTLNMPETISGRIQGHIASAGAWSEKEWYANIKDTDIAGSFNNTPFKIKGDIGLTPSGHVSQGKLFISANNSELTLISADNTFWDLTGNVKVNNVNLWYREIQGTFSSDFSIKGSRDNPTIRLSTIASAFNWSKWHSDTLHINGVYSPMLDHQVELTLLNKKLTWINKDHSVEMSDFTLKLSGDATQHQLQTHWLGDISGQLELTGHFDDSFTKWHSTIEKNILTYKNSALEGNKSFAVNFDLAKRRGTIASHCWKTSGVSACLPKQAIIGDIGEITAQITVDIEVIDELFLPKEFDIISQLNGDVKITWSPQQSINTKADFYLSPGYITVSDEFNIHTLSHWSTGAFSFVLNDQQLTNKIQLIDVNEQPLININTVMKLVDDFPVDAQIILHEVDLQPFQSMLSKVVDLQGKLTTDIAISGTLAAPIMNGDIKLNNGKIQLEQNANVIDNLSTDLSIHNNKAILNGHFLLEDKRANITGQLSWQDDLTINLDLSAKAIPLVFPPQLIMNMSPSLNFLYAKDVLTVSGNIDVLEGNYNIDKLPEDSVPLSDDVIIVDQNGQAIVKKTTNINIKTNVNVNIAKAFTVSGQGLQSHLFGQLQISQQEKQPIQLFGSIQSDNGVFQAYGQKLQIEKGDITFNGPTNNPYIDLRASKKIPSEDITVGIQVAGLADTLSMQLYSTPTMQTPEILSYLVRGRGLDADTGNSTTAAGLLVGMSITNNIGLFEQIEKLPLISNLAIDTEGVGEQTQATVSGYVGNRVYLKYGIGVYEPINELTVRMYMFNRFWLEIVSGIEKSTDIYYSFDIE